MSEVVRVGIDCKLYRDSAASWASPVWVEMKDVRDCTTSMEKDQADANRRGSKVKRYVGAMKDYGIEFDFLRRKDDGTSEADFQALLDSFLNNTRLNVAAMDGDIETAGSEGLHVEMECFRLTRGEQMGSVVIYSVLLKPTDSDHEAEWLEVE